MKSIDLFPHIESKYYDDNVSVNALYSFMKNDESMNLKLTQLEKNKEYKLDDTDGFWTFQDLGFKGTFTIELKNTKELFNESGVAVNDAIIGVGLEEISTPTKTRKFSKIGLIKSTDNTLKFDKKVVIEPFSIRKEIEFVLVFYIDTPGSCGSENSFLANEPGLIIGKKHIHKILLEGSGSSFPIFDTPSDIDLLWNVIVNANDFYEEFSEENVKIILNSKHPDYKYINKNDKAFCLPMLKEVLASAMQTMILEMKSNFSSFDFNEESDEGSIQNVLTYFKDVLEWDLSSPKTIINSIKIYLDKEYLS